MVCDERIRSSDAEKRKKHHNGELAQLGERLLCTQEVSGSIPLFSTILAKSTLESHSRITIRFVTF